VTESHLGGILQPKNTKGFVEAFRKSLADKMARVESAGELMPINGVMDELLKELSAEKSFSAEMETLIEKVAKIHVADMSKEATENFLKLVDSKVVDGLFVNPANLNEKAQELLRCGLDSVVTLQKLGHQHLAEVTRG